MLITEGRIELEIELNESSIIFFNKNFYCSDSHSTHHFDKINSPYWVNTHSCMKEGDIIPKHKIEGYFTPHFKCYNCGMILIHIGDGQFKIGNDGVRW